MIAKSIMVILELQEIYLCLLKDFYRSLYRQRESERKVYFKQNGVWGFLPQQGCKTVECTVINLIQRWERRKNVLGKRFFQVSGVRFKQQFQWPLWFLFQTKGSNLVQGYCCLLPASSFVLLGISLSLPRVWLCPLLGQQHLSSVTLRSAVLTGDFFFPPPLLISHFLCCAWSFFLLMTLMSLSFLCLIYASVFLPYQTLCSLLYLPSLSVFCPLMTFLSFLFPFVYLLLTSLFFPLCVILFMPSPALSFLTSYFCPLPYSTFLLTFFLQAVPLVAVLFLVYVYIYFT